LRFQPEHDYRAASSCGGSTADLADVSTDVSQLHCAADVSAHEETEVHENFTTVILRGIPLSYTRDIVLATLNGNGYFGQFDFLYLPKNFGTNEAFGYAFINFPRPETAARFMSDFRGFSNWSVPANTEASVEWMDGNQGLNAQIERYRNSGMMHSSVSDDARPIILRDGMRIPFPAPTQPLKPLRVRAWKKNASACINR